MRRRAFLGIAVLGTAVPGGWFLATDRSPTYRLDLEAATFAYAFSMRSLGPDPGAHLPVAFEAAPVDDSIRPLDPARFDLSIGNAGDERIGVASGAPGPFGVLRATSASGDRVTLWSDAYAESEHVHTTGRGVRAVNDIGIVTELSPGESRTREYRIGRWRLAPGTYTVAETVGIRRGEGESATTTPFPYELTIEIR